MSNLSPASRRRLAAIAAILALFTVAWTPLDGGPAPERSPEHVAVQPTLVRELLAKADPDGCLDDDDTDLDTDVDACETFDKVNQAYVWGLTEADDKLWFGTAPNVHCLVLDVYLQQRDGSETDSSECLRGGAAANVVPADLFSLDTRSGQLTELAVAGESASILLQTTVGIRSAGSDGNTVIFAGPAAGLDGGGVAFFAFDAEDGSFLDSHFTPAYTNIRKWITVDGELYTGVQTADGRGAILRWNATTPDELFDFTTVGTTDGQVAELAEHDGRIAVSTWPNRNSKKAAGVHLSPPVGDLPGDATVIDVDPCDVHDVNGRSTGELAGQFVPPCLPPCIHQGQECAIRDLCDSEVQNHLCIDDVEQRITFVPGWEQILSFASYEPDPLIAMTYGGGALHSYGGDLYVGTMHVPGTSFLAHQQRGASSDLMSTLFDVIATNRAIAVFRIDTAARDQATATATYVDPTQGVELLYGEAALPAYGPGGWTLRPTGFVPTYGASGFGNPFNNYTWTMAEFGGQLHVGTMDWSYLLAEQLPRELRDVLFVDGVLQTRALVDLVFDELTPQPVGDTPTGLIVETEDALNALASGVLEMQVENGEAEPTDLERFFDQLVALGGVEQDTADALESYAERMEEEGPESVLGDPDANLELRGLVTDALDDVLGTHLAPNQWGADLWRFPNASSAAVPESVGGVGNISTYGIRTMLARPEGLYLGMANPMNKLVDRQDGVVEGGWELLRLTPRRSRPISRPPAPVDPTPLTVVLADRTVTVTEQSVEPTSREGLTTLPAQAIIERTGDAEGVTELVFRIPAELLPDGADARSVAVRRDGEIVRRCVGDVTPDPCVASVGWDGEELVLTVRTTRFSTWDFTHPVKGTIDLACKGALASPFADAVDNRHERTIACADVLGLVSGYDDGTFRPGANVTRGQVATLLAGVLEELGHALPTSPADAFGDDDGNPHETALDQLAELGIVTGDRAGDVRPGAAISREQLASMVARVYELVADRVVEAPNAFGDDHGSTHEHAIDVVSHLGIVLGTGDGTFSPKEPVIRAHAATIVVKAYNRMLAEGLDRG